MKRIKYSLITLFSFATAMVSQADVNILWVQYLTANDTLKLAAHTDANPMAPTNATVDLYLKSGSGWTKERTVKVDPLTTVAEFRIDDWNTKRDRQYRVVSGFSEITGTIRKDPVNKSIIKLMGVSCVNDKRFPYQKTVEQMVAQNPDLVFFLGDQLYRSNAGGEWIDPYEDDQVIPAMKGYLAKWRKFGLTFRDLLKDRPCVIITDDHDVYARDLWGKGGELMTGGRTDGGYFHMDWTNAVERVQTWILPDAANPGPWGDGVMAYYSSMDFGGLSIALLEDRKFKSAPTDILKKAVDDPRTNEPNTTLEVVKDPTFDIDTLDAPGLNLLGNEQEAFVADWAKDVEKSGKLAVVLHQSPYANIANYHRTFGDMDSSAWPPTPRDRTLRSLSSANPVLISGDMHYGTILKHGVDEWGDGPWEFSLPPFGSGVNRLWNPSEPPQGGAIPGMPGSGNHHDRFGNKLTLIAKSDGGVGYGMILLDKDSRDVTFQFHPTDPTTRDPIEGDVPGWPKRIRVK